MAGKEKSAALAEKHELIKVGKSKIHGNGVFARKAIPWGTRIVEYRGKRLSGKAIEQSVSDALFELDDKTAIDGRVQGNIAQFINHARDNPNCFILRERGKIWIIAGISGIKKGDELTYDYGWEYYD